MNDKQIEKISKAISDSNRLSILKMLSEKEEIGCDLLSKCAITQPTLSHHMKILCDCELVNDRRDGKFHYYTINHDTLAAYIEFLKSLENGR